VPAAETAIASGTALSATPSGVPREDGVKLQIRVGRRFRCHVLRWHQTRAA
jgi:hypothetical protein